MTTETGIIDINSLMDGNAISVEKVEAKSGEFPTLKMHHPIQTTLANPNTMNIHFDKDNITLLDGPYELTTIASKSAIRLLVEEVTDEGEKKYYNKWYGKFSDQAMIDAYENIKQEKYEEFRAMPKLKKLTDDQIMVKAKKEADNAKGTARLVLIKFKDASFLIEFETYKVYMDYWKVLNSATIGNRAKMVVKISDHTKNLKVMDNGFSYHNPAMFKQYDVKPMSEDEVNVAKDLLTKNVEAVSKWSTKLNNIQEDNNKKKD